MGAALFFVQALSMVLANAQDQKNAKTQYEYQKRLQAESVANAGVYASGAYGALLNRSQQIHDALAVKTSNARRSARQAASGELVNAAETGIVTGTTAGDIQQSFTSKLSEYIGLVEGQEEQEQIQVERQKDAARIQQQNSIQVANPVATPNPYVLYGGIASAFAGSYAGSGGDAGPSFDAWLSFE
jgi:hypothetical protein